LHNLKRNPLHLNDHKMRCRKPLKLRERGSNPNPSSRRRKRNLFPLNQKLLNPKPSRSGRKRRSPLLRLA
jgi:hypothetical protein